MMKEGKSILIAGSGLAGISAAIRAAELGIADPEAVASLTRNAPDLIGRLASLGVVFSRDSDGRPDLRYFGGQSKKRTVYSRAGIGKQLVSGLSAVLRRYEAEGRVRLLFNRKILKCILCDGKFAGVITEDRKDGRLEYLASDCLIAASGGLGGLFPMTTGSCASDGSLSAALFAAGIEMGNLGRKPDAARYRFAEYLQSLP